MQRERLHDTLTGSGIPVQFCGSQGSKSQSLGVAFVGARGLENRFLPVLRFPAFYRGQRLTLLRGSPFLRSAYVAFVGPDSLASRCVCILNGFSVSVRRDYLTPFSDA